MIELPNIVTSSYDIVMIKNHFSLYSHIWHSYDIWASASSLYSHIFIWHSYSIMYAVASLSSLYSHIILMLADDMACNPRNAYPGEHSWCGCGNMLAPPPYSKSIQQLQKEPQHLWRWCRGWLQGLWGKEVVCVYGCVKLSGIPFTGYCGKLPTCSHWYVVTRVCWVLNIL